MRNLLCPLTLILAATCLTALPAEEKKADNKILTDQEFVTAASAGGLAEVNLSRLAMERAQRPEVKNFAQEMIKDHTKANEELLKLADSKKLTPARQMDATHQALANDLAQMKGEAFDRAYLKAMEKDHADAIIVFEAAHLTVPDKDLKAFAGKTLATIKVHDLEVKGLCKQYKDANPANSGKDK
jgi:putative membrane protein